MRTLVTGGAGFIGSTLVDRLLAEGHDVDVVDDLSTGSLANLAEARSARTQRLHIHQVDVRDAGVVDLIERRRPEVVFHLAGRDGADVVDDADLTILGGLRVIEGARRGGSRKVVVASTAAIYRPPEPAELPLRESHPHQPVEPHGVAAEALTAYLVAYRERFDLEFTALALGSVYGPRQRSGVVVDVVRSILAGEPCEVAGGPGRTVDLVFVDDVVDALVRAAERGSGLVVNVGSGVETSLGSLHAAVAAGTGQPAGTLRARADDDGGAPVRMALDPGRARIHLGWSPWTALEDGLALVVGEPGRPPA